MAKRVPLKELIETAWPHAPIEICHLVHSFVTISPQTIAKYPTEKRGYIHMLCDGTCSIHLIMGVPIIFGKHADEYKLVPGDVTLSQPFSNYIFTCDEKNGILHVVGRNKTLTHDLEVRNVFSCIIDIDNGMVDCLVDAPGLGDGLHVRTFPLPDDYVQNDQVQAFNVMDNQTAYITTEIIDDEPRDMVVIAAL